MRSRLPLGVIAILAVAAAWTPRAIASQAGTSGPIRGAWRINYVSPSSVDLELSYHAVNSSHVEEDTVAFHATGFGGLSINDVKSARGDKHFQIARDAGTFDCNGYFDRGVGSGVFEFVSSAGFAAGLESRGLGRPGEMTQFELALANVTLAVVDRLRAAGVTGLTAQSLVKLAEHDVNGRYVSALAANGVKAASVDDLVRLRDHDVSADFVAGLARYGYHPDAQGLIRLRDHDVSLDFVARLQAHGYHPSIDDLIRLRDSGM